jgi:hypothetical protein
MTMNGCRLTGIAAELRAEGPSDLAAGSAAAGGQHAGRSRDPRSHDRLRSGELLSELVSLCRHADLVILPDSIVGIPA